MSLMNNGNKSSWPNNTVKRAEMSWFADVGRPSHPTDGHVPTAVVSTNARHVRERNRALIRF
jgi:hypothetical protein